jgi:hypothetical protein
MGTSTKANARHSLKALEERQSRGQKAAMRGELRHAKLPGRDVICMKAIASIHRLLTGARQAELFIEMP